MIQYWSVTDTHPPSHPPSDVAVAITLNAKASSLIIHSDPHDPQFVTNTEKIRKQNRLQILLNNKLNFHSIPHTSW